MKNTPDWIPSSFIYHLYPLGLTSAPNANPLNQPVEHRIHDLYPWLDHLQWLGVNTLFLGPVIQSSSHGYDLVDYFQIDRRLGDNQSFQKFAQEVHRRGMRLILDAVFNHSGRDFFAFRDIKEKGQHSSFIDWYEGIRFDRHSPKGDAFDYHTWAGHYSLPKFNLSNPSVREYLFEAVRFWIKEWDIDGLRLDAADHVRMDFWHDLRQLTTSLRPNFWLMGEVVHGQYHHWANIDHLHSVTNYEAYKGLYSSLNDKNYFEIAHTLQRQFSVGGVYDNLHLYNFVDNHDVNRIASQLHQPQHLFPLYALLFSMPGVPSVYYGSEWGIKGQRTAYSDQDLRPSINLDEMIQHAPEPNLPVFIQRLTHLRAGLPALQTGDYHQAYISSQQFAFWRSIKCQRVLVALNAAPETVTLPGIKIDPNLKARSVLEDQSTLQIRNEEIILQLQAYGVAMIVFEDEISNNK